MKLGYVRLLTERFDETFDFYAKTLGIEVTWGRKGEVYASFKVNEEITLSIFDGRLMDSHIGHSTEVRQSISDKAMLVFEVQSVDEQYRAFARVGVTCINAPQDMPGWGIRCFHLRDPEGNLIEVCQELPREKWSTDLLAEEAR